MSLTSHEEIGRVGRVGRRSSRGCHEDAARKTVPWKFKLYRVTTPTRTGLRLCCWPRPRRAARLAAHSRWHVTIKTYCMAVSQYSTVNPGNLSCDCVSVLWKASTINTTLGWHPGSRSVWVCRSIRLLRLVSYKLEPANCLYQAPQGVTQVAVPRRGVAGVWERQGGLSICLSVCSLQELSTGLGARSSARAWRHRQLETLPQSVLSIVKRLAGNSVSKMNYLMSSRFVSNLNSINQSVNQLINLYLSTGNTWSWRCTTAASPPSTRYIPSTTSSTNRGW